MHRSRLLAAAGTAGATAAGCSVLARQPRCLSKDAAAEEQPPTLIPAIGPKATDAILAGLGLWGGCSVLGLLEPVVGVRLFAPPMMASGIIFFYGAEPPHPKGFLSGTFCAATLTLGTYMGASLVFPPVVAQGAAAGSLLCWYKATGAVFPPAAVLAGALTAAAVGSPAPGAASMRATLSYLAFPWLAGHAWVRGSHALSLFRSPQPAPVPSLRAAQLYACACGTSVARSRARVAMTTHRLAAFKDHTDEDLRAVFERFDTNGNGALDASELKVALRVALGLDLSLEDCQELVAFADRDGTGQVEFDEFKAVCREQL